MPLFAALDRLKAAPTPCAPWPRNRSSGGCKSLFRNSRYPQLNEGPPHQAGLLRAHAHFSLTTSTSELDTTAKALGPDGQWLVVFNDSDTPVRVEIAVILQAALLSTKKARNAASGPFLLKRNCA
ncbi:hypothetical protein [Hymenobacter negativus]|uniref:Glycosyl hydrolase family 30 beta sandwich domain-containing protein n=1 Tax=Hymenobacter negativus TaxID=2795026 RepID=A0ABS0Q6M2_9BACT|nr:hypothetical protein [Hymenobacter negativus]MBH8558289.1 hypothetical protein [Hymenobacter negativus]